MTTEPTPEDFAAKPKTKLDLVYAAGAEGEVYAIPLDIARKHRVNAAEEGEPFIDLERAAVTNEEDDAEEEVAGHHADGGLGYHGDWRYGTYCWRKDGNWYTGWHHHPNWFSHLAVDHNG
ncbi:MAG: hypothetical protein ACI9R3_001745 [Verrucomicrobiales bacterium]|jgi:hypothetical protein